MSQTKAQLVAPIGVVTASGVVASGVVTASSFDAGSVTGTATSIIEGSNLNVGIMSATSFAGDFTGTATGITTGSDIKVGAFTASSFTGDFTGTATSMMRGTGFEAGAVNATGFVANVVGDVTGNTTGLAASVTSGGNIHVGVMTATSYSGDGGSLTGIAATNFNTQVITTDSAETIIDLADGNCITMNQAGNTTVGFASTSSGMDVTLMRIPFVDYNVSYATGGVDFDGTGDYLSLADSDDFDMGTGDFTVECWINLDDLSSNRNIWTLSGYDTGGELFINSNGLIGYYVGTQFIIQTSSGFIKANKWYHIAVTRSSGTARMFINGTEIGSASQSGAFPTSGTSQCYIGAEVNGAGTATGTVMKGKISNFRVVKGTAVYTSSFRPPTEPLTNITNTKLLCCNNSSTTGSTVTPGTITAVGTVTASIVTPFDDPEGFKFGEEGDSEVIKCGVYQGNANADGPEVFLGWEPEWVMLKSASGTENWLMFDSMRGIPTDENTSRLFANTFAAESAAENFIDVTPTGFKIKDNGGDLNGSNGFILYIAIRRADGYVGKPPELGTGVFAMDTGNGSSTIPAFDSGFPVGLGLSKKPGNAFDSWHVAPRLMGGKHLYTNQNVAEQSDTVDDLSTDSNVGYGKNWNSDYQSWMWKRGAGFDVVCYTGDDAASKDIAHSLGKTPEMIWIKCRNDTAQWVVGHKGRNGGVNPWNYFSALNGTGADEDNTMFNDTPPTSTHFTVGTDNDVNDTDTYIAMLFASVDGISKCGYYTGDNTSDGSKVITTGFTPRFIIIKSTSNAEVWVVLDTLRGMTTGSNEKVLYLNSSDAQVSVDAVDVSATGFSFRAASGEFNANGFKYIYYAHA